MPYGYGSVGTLTSSSGGDITGSRQYTRLKGPVLVGQQPDISGGPNNQINAPHIVNVSTAMPDLITGLSTSITALSGSSSAWSVSTGTPTGLVYFTQTTGAGNIIAAGSTANAPTGLPGGMTCPALLWDAAQKTLAIFDPGSATWMWPHQASTVAGAGATITWSASSS